MYKILLANVDSLDDSEAMETLLSCFMGMNDLEIKVFKILQSSREQGRSLDCEEIARQVGRSRSTVQRALKRLMETHEVVTRDVVSGVSEASTGYKYTYSLLEPASLREKFKSRLEVVVDKMLSIIDNYF